MLAEEVSSRNITKPDLIIIDGCAMLWGGIHWPLDGKVADLVEVVASYVAARLVKSDVLLTFDRYHEMSTKGCTRDQRSTEKGGRHFLTIESSLPCKIVAMTITENKVQLINLIFKELPQPFKKLQYKHKLLITGKEPAPVEINLGVQIVRHDLSITHEEADVIMTNQAMTAALEGYQSIHVICDDTDVFILLTHFYHALGVKCDIYMVPISSDRKVTDIAATCQKQKSHHISYLCTC